MISLISWSFDFFATTFFSRSINVFWLNACEIVNIVDVSFFLNILFIVAVWLLISFCFCYLVSLVNRSLCDIDVTIFLFFCSIVTSEKIVDMKKMRTFTLDVVVSTTCNIDLLRNVFFCFDSILFSCWVFYVSFNVILLTRIATMTIRLLLNVAMLNAMFLCTIFTRLLVSTLVCSVIVFLTFEALLNTTHRLVVLHYFRRTLVQYIMMYQFIRPVDVCQFQHRRRKILFMTLFWNSS